jgi:Fe-S oxidoreductase
MCPSFRVTREEQHSTRGRARLLFEMLEGSPLTGGWRDEHVKEALDLCLSCKGCKGDCPVGVDMATYKSEFLAHYFKGRLRPRHALAFGFIHYWARLAAISPGLANAFAGTPGLRAIVKKAAGIARERAVPRFASQTFTQWFARRRAPARTGSPVILWPDTFNNHFHPETAIAAVRTLERAGFDVTLPASRVCCGRPLYDYGMLTTARRWLEDILGVLATEIARGTPVVGLEPSCVAVFRDELRELLPDREDAKRLAAQTFLLSEFLNDHDYRYPTLRRRALVHAHCHHKAIMKLDSLQHALEAMHLDFEILDDGCCGMAGAFGFEDTHYDISMKIGERVLLPAVRAAAADTLLVADGFSCRTQIEQATGRRTMHLADLLELGAQGNG